jgi:hypothetical protein
VSNADLQKEGKIFTFSTKKGEEPLVLSPLLIGDYASLQFVLPPHSRLNVLA